MTVRKRRERTTPVGRMLRAADKAETTVRAIAGKSASWGEPSRQLTEACQDALVVLARVKRRAEELAARGFVPPAKREGLSLERGDLVAIAPQHRDRYPGRGDLDALIVFEASSPDEVVVVLDDGDGTMRRPVFKHKLTVPRHHLARRRSRDEEAA